MKVFRSKIKGAVFVARCTRAMGVRVWTVRRGLKKNHGCVEFWPDIRLYDYRYLYDFECKKKYNDLPPASTAWLVYPCKNSKDFWWKRVDNLIDFS